MTLRSPDARRRDRDAHGGEFPLDALGSPIAGSPRQSEDERRGPFSNDRPARTAVRVGPALGDEVTGPRATFPAGPRTVQDAGGGAGEPKRRALLGRLAAGSGGGAGVGGLRPLRSMMTSIAKSMSVRKENRIRWRTRQNALYKNMRATTGCWPCQTCDFKSQPTAHGRAFRHSQAISRII